MTRKEDEWDCTDCGTPQGRHDQWFEGGVCGDCHGTQKNVAMKGEVEHMLIKMWVSIGIDIPNNYEDIVQYCFEDVLETSDHEHWHSGDVAIAFRRWIEAQTPEVNN